MVQSHYHVVPLNISSLLWVVCVSMCDNRFGFLGFQTSQDQLSMWLFLSQDDEYILWFTMAFSLEGNVLTFLNIFKCQNQLPVCLCFIYLCRIILNTKKLQITGRKQATYVDYEI